MATKVHMEALSPTMEEGQLVQWLKAEGDDIANGDILAEIETDKATMELVARGEGVLRKIFLTAGGTAEVGSVIGVIAGADEDISGIAGVSGGGATAAPTAPPEAPAEGAPMPAAQTLPAPEAPAVSAPATSAPATTAAATLPASAANGGRLKASPLARRLA